MIYYKVSNSFYMRGDKEGCVFAALAILFFCAFLLSFYWSDKKKGDEGEEEEKNKGGEFLIGDGTGCFKLMWVHEC